MLQLVDLGQIDRVDQGEAGQGAGDDCQHQQTASAERPASLRRRCMGARGIRSSCLRSRTRDSAD